MRIPFKSQATPSEIRGKSISYRPELDGIRGLAIIIIVFHHFDYVGLKYFNGRGFLAVDIFFALSGFLITQILLSYRAKGIKLHTFYLRRVARLYPILLASTLGLSYYLRNDYQFLDRAPAIRSILYIKNFWPWGGVFGPMWSLSAEEQFYLIFPIILIAGVKFLKKRAFTVLLLMWIAAMWSIGFIASGTPHNFNADGVFNLVVFRPSIILVGSLIAMHKDWLEEKVAKFYYLTFALFIALAYLSYTSEFPPLAGISTGILILLLSDKATSRLNLAKYLKAALAFKPLAWLGLLSYSIYIWHLPMIFFSTQHFMIHAISPLWPFLVKLLAVSAVSFYLFERPVLKLIAKASPRTK